MTVYLLRNLKEAMRDFFSEIGHTHDVNQVNDLQTTLDSKANSSHTHDISDVTNLQTTLDGKALSSHTHDDRYYTESEINTLLNSKANTTNNTSWTNGTFNLSAYTGVFKGMMRNGFATIKFEFKLNGSSSQSQVTMGYLPAKFKPAGDEQIEFAIKRFGDSNGEKISSCKTEFWDNKIYFVIYAGASISSDTSFVGTLVYPIDDY